MEKEICPRCGKEAKLVALSRRNNLTYICSDCGTEEALIDAGFVSPTREEILFRKKLKIRHCYYAMDNTRTNHYTNGAIIIVMVKEGEQGYYPTKKGYNWNKREEAETFCKQLNELWGITPEETMKLVAQSMWG